MDDLSWKQAKMKRYTAQAAEAVESLYAAPEPVPDPSFVSSPAASSVMAKYGAQGEAPAGVDPQHVGAVQTVQPTQYKPDLQGDSPWGRGQPVSSPPVMESVAGGALKGGGWEALNAAGDVGDMASAIPMYAGRKLGKGINKALGMELPTQSQTDEAGLESDLVGAWNRVSARGVPFMETGDISEAPNERKGLTSTVIGETIESGKLALDPNASAGERMLGGIGAVAGAGSVVLGGGAPTRINPGTAMSGYVDTVNTGRVIRGQRPIPNPSLRGLLTPPSDLGDPSKLSGVFAGAGAKTKDEYIERAAKEIRGELLKLAKKGEHLQYDTKLAEAIEGADTAKIAAALRNPKADPDLHKAIREVYGITKKEMDKDIRTMGADEAINTGTPPRPSPETKPSVDEVRERLAGEYGVPAEKLSNTVKPNEANQAARELGISPVEMNQADKQIAKSMDSPERSVRDENFADVLGGAAKAEPEDVAQTVGAAEEAAPMAAKGKTPSPVMGRLVNAKPRASPPALKAHGSPARQNLPEGMLSVAALLPALARRACSLLAKRAAWVGSAATPRSQPLTLEV
jgi:hypothetical protein